MTQDAIHSQMFECQGYMLLPCPFCGSKNLSVEDDCEGGLQVSCNREGCGAIGPGSCNYLRQNNIVAWNRRCKAGKELRLISSQDARNLAYTHTFQLDDVLASIGRFAMVLSGNHHIATLASLGRKMLDEIEETLAVRFEQLVIDEYETVDAYDSQDNITLSVYHDENGNIRDTCAEFCCTECGVDMDDFSPEPGSQFLCPYCEEPQTAIYRFWNYHDGPVQNGPFFPDIAGPISGLSDQDDGGKS